MVVYCTTCDSARHHKWHDCDRALRHHMGLCILWSCDSHYGVAHKYRVGSVYSREPSHHRCHSHQRVYTALQSHSCSSIYICASNCCLDLSVQTVYWRTFEIVNMWTVVKRRSMFQERTFHFDKAKMDAIRSTCTIENVSSLSNGRWKSNDPKSRQEPNAHARSGTRGGTCSLYSAQTGVGRGKAQLWSQGERAVRLR